MKKWTKNFDLNTNTSHPKIAAVVSVYNKPRDLQLCLEGWQRQSFLLDHPLELHLILADDGSGPETEEIFSKFSAKVSFPTTFLHQNHRGWGKLRMSNWAILESKADQIIFTDGDCIPHIQFVKNHFESFEENAVCCGRRADLMEEITKNLTLEDVKTGTLDSNFWLLQNILKDKIEYGGHGFYFPEWTAKIIRLFSRTKSPTLLGSNFSIYKKWLFEINGFDETFETPGIGEDTDLERRLKMMGLKLKWITHRAIQLHLWHPLTEVGEKTWQTFEMLKNKSNRTALKGLKELQSELGNLSL